MSSSNLPRIIALESKYELLKLYRTPGFSIPTLAFPIFFYLFFGVLFGGAKSVGDATLGQYLIGTYSAFGVIGAALTAFGLGVATERGQGWLQLKHATPMPFVAYVVAKLLAAMAFGAVIAIALFTLGGTLGGVKLEAIQWLTLFIVLVAGTVPFALLGLTIGYLAPVNSAPAIVNTIYLPLGFLSGLWIPIEVLPRMMRSTAQWLPPFHFGQLAVSVIGIPVKGTVTSHVVALVGFSLIFGVTAIVAYRRDRVRNYA